MFAVVLVEGGTPSIQSSHDDVLTAYHAWHDFVVATLAPEEQADPTGVVALRLGFPGWSDDVWASLDRGEDATLYLNDEDSVSVCQVV